MNISRYYEIESSLNESICSNDYIKSLDILLEMLSIKMDIDDYLPISLVENVCIANNFSEYMPLIEATDAISSIEKDLSELSKSDNKENKDNILKKCVKTFKSVVDWWYKIEPNKKFKTLHTVLKLLVKILMFVADIYIADVVTKKVLDTKTISKIPDKVLKFGNKDISIKGNIIKLLTGYGLGKISDFVKSLTVQKMEFNINKKDLDKNISELDKGIDKLNNIISKTNDSEMRNSLIKTKTELENTLSELMRLKSKNEK